MSRTISIIHIQIPGACKQVWASSDVDSIEIDDCGDVTAAAEGAALGLYEFSTLKKKKNAIPKIVLHKSTPAK
jgi:hypothetical protein